MLEADNGAAVLLCEEGNEATRRATHGPLAACEGGGTLDARPGQEVRGMERKRDGVVIEYMRGGSSHPPM